jgi:type II secretory pathway pseudopilin PulG
VHRTRKRIQAFTMVEIMIAVVILVLGFMPIYSMMQAGTKRARFQKIRAFGLSLAQNYLERVRGCSLMYLDADGPIFDAGQLQGVPNLWAGGPGGVIDLFAKDPLLNPKAGNEGVPGDDEMKALIEHWERRGAIFHPIPGKVSPSWSEDLAKLKMRIITSSVTWSKAYDQYRRPTSLDEFRSGKNGKRYQGREVVSLVAISGEGLFHPPPSFGI